MILVSTHHAVDSGIILQIDSTLKLPPQRYIQYLPVNVIRWMLLHKFMEFTKEPVKRMEDKIQDIVLRNNYKYTQFHQKRIKNGKESEDRIKHMGKSNTVV